MDELRWIFLGMGAIFLILGFVLGWLEVRLRKTLTRGEGKITGSVFSREVNTHVPLVETEWNGTPVKVEAAPVPLAFLNEHMNQKVTVWLGGKAGVLSGLPKCFIETGKAGALPGVRRVLMMVVIFGMAGLGLTAAGLLIR